MRCGNVYIASSPHRLSHPQVLVKCIQQAFMATQTPPIREEIHLPQVHAQRGSGSRSISDWIDRRAHIVYPLPSGLVLIFLFILPIAYTVYLSFHAWGLSASTAPRPVGWDNYADLFANERFRGAVTHTFYYAFLAVVIEVTLGIGIALVFAREFLGRGLARTLFLFPMMATPLAAMIGWKLILDPNTGVINLLASWGMPKFAPLAERALVIPTLVFVDVWQWTPFVTLIILAGLSALPLEPYEAAVIDGASGRQLFFYITLPLLRPVIIIAALFRTIDSLKTFENIFVLTRGEPAFASETLNLYAYLESFEYYHMGFASALMIVYFLIILIFTVVLLRFRRTAW